MVSCRRDSIFNNSRNTYRCGTFSTREGYFIVSKYQPLVMIVDDDVFERLGASYMFSDAGYRVLEAGNADEALQFLEINTDVRLLFTDVSMPGSMSGSDLACQVAKRWPEVSLIVTSGRPRPDTLPSGTKFHSKPYEPANVLRHASEMTIPRE